MTHNKTTSQIKKLEQERAQIAQELVRLREALKSEVDGDVGEGDPELVERGMIMTRIYEQERKLKAIEDVLQHAQQGMYGICERCGKPIDPARLEAVPETTFCLECKMIVEKQSRTRVMTSGFN
jgi:RNA polymerase-binding transcription factor DksA